MKRSEFLATAAPATFTGVGRRAVGEVLEDSSYASAPAVKPEDRQHYFTESRLPAIVDATADLSAYSFEVVAYNLSELVSEPFRFTLCDVGFRILFRGIRFLDKDRPLPA